MQMHFPLGLVFASVLLPIGADAQSTESEGRCNCGMGYLDGAKETDRFLCQAKIEVGPGDDYQCYPPRDTLVSPCDGTDTLCSNDAQTAETSAPSPPTPKPTKKCRKRPTPSPTPTPIVPQSFALEENNQLTSQVAARSATNQEQEDEPCEFIGLPCWVFVLLLGLLICCCSCCMAAAFYVGLKQLHKKKKNKPDELEVLPSMRHHGSITRSGSHGSSPCQWVFPMSPTAVGNKVPPNTLSGANMMDVGGNIGRAGSFAGSGHFDLTRGGTIHPYDAAEYGGLPDGHRQSSVRFASFSSGGGAPGVVGGGNTMRRVASIPPAPGSPLNSTYSGNAAVGKSSLRNSMSAGTFPPPTAAKLKKPNLNLDFYRDMNTDKNTEPESVGGSNSTSDTIPKKPPTPPENTAVVEMMPAAAAPAVMMPPSASGGNQELDEVPLSDGEEGDAPDQKNQNNLKRKNLKQAKGKQNDDDNASAGFSIELETTSRKAVLTTLKKKNKRPTDGANEDDDLPFANYTGYYGGAIPDPNAKKVPKKPGPRNLRGRTGSRNPSDGGDSDDQSRSASLDPARSPSTKFKPRSLRGSSRTPSPSDHSRSNSSFLSVSDDGAAGGPGGKLKPRNLRGRSGSRSPTPSESMLDVFSAFNDGGEVEPPRKRSPSIRPRTLRGSSRSPSVSSFVSQPTPPPMVSADDLTIDASLGATAAPQAEPEEAPLFIKSNVLPMDADIQEAQPSGPIQSEAMQPAETPIAETPQQTPTTTPTGKNLLRKVLKGKK